MYPIKQSAVLDAMFFAHDSSGNPVAGKLDGDWTKNISKNAAAFASMTVTITDRGGGWYHLQLSATHTDTLGILSAYFTATGVQQVNLQFRVHARVPDDLAFPAASGQSLTVETDGHVHADIKEWLGVAPLALVAQRVNADAVAISGSAIAADGVEANIGNLDAAVSSRANGSDYTAGRAANLDNLDATVSSRGTAANQTTILDRLGDFAGSGLNTVKGFFQALFRKDAGVAGANLPAEINELENGTAGTYDPTSDSQEGIRDTEPLGTAMRGTDSAALASDYTAGRAANLDNIDEAVSAAKTLTASERDSVAAALLDLAGGIEAGADPQTLRQAMRIILAAASGKTSGAGTTSFAIRDRNDTKDRITAVTTLAGDRTSVTVDGT